MVIKGATLEKSFYHKRSFEHGGIINIRYILNNKTSNTQCYSTSDTILAKIPIKLVEENVNKNVTKKIFEFFFIMFIKF